MADAPPSGRPGGGLVLPPSFHALMQLVAALLAWAVAGTLATQVVAPPEEPLAEKIEALMLVTGWAGLGVILVGIYWPGTPWRGRVGGRRAARLVAIAYPAFLLVWVPVGMLGYPYLLELLDVELAQQEQLDYFGHPPASALGPWIAVLVACVIAPAAEEVLYRGYLQRWAGLLAPRWVAVLGTSVLFGLAHGVEYAFPLMLLGLLFGWLRERTGGLCAPILAHALHNSLTVVAKVAFPELFEQVY